jgi:hypothetical protein
MGLKKHGPGEAPGDGKYRRIEALKVARLDDTTGSFGACDQVVGLGKICGQGLFDQQVNAGIEQSSSDGMMMDGGHCDAGGLNIEVSSEKFSHGGKNRNLELRRGLLGASRIRLDCRNQRCAFTGRLQFAIHAEMIAAECACAGNSNAQLACTRYFAASFSCGAFGESA